MAMIFNAGLEPASGLQPRVRVLTTVPSGEIRRLPTATGGVPAGKPPAISAASDWKSSSAGSKEFVCKMGDPSELTVRRRQRSGLPAPPVDLTFGGLL